MRWTLPSRPKSVALRSPKPLWPPLWPTRLSSALTATSHTQNAALVARAIQPDYALGGHTASLGLVFYRGDLFPARYKGGVFIGQHGSWNRRPPSGYRVVFVPFANGKPSGQPEVFLSGFLNAKDEAQGRPVGVAVDRAGALLVADDVGKAVWRVTPAEAPPAPAPR